MNFVELKRTDPGLYAHLEQGARNLLYIGLYESLADLVNPDDWFCLWADNETENYRARQGQSPKAFRSAFMNKEKRDGVATQESVAAQIAAAANRLRGVRVDTQAMPGLTPEQTQAAVIKGLSAEQARIAEQIAKAANKRRGKSP